MVSLTFLQTLQDNEIIDQSTGVPVNQACQQVYQSLKLHKKDKYIIFALNKDNTEIIVEKKSESTDYEDFLKDLPEDHPRWAVYDFNFEVEDGGKRNKLVFISWCVFPAHVCASSNNHNSLATI